ncbi:MAG: hypothetical protein KAS32_31025 [Candidatus Peribacteraceae bacterium]|nr:hypothetical protein [Candidatus Peribacteraceae bacterium]
MATWNKPPALALQLDRCDVCGDKYHRGNLVRTQVEFLRMKAENYIVQSSYDGDYWTYDTTTDAGTISYGNRCDNVRLSLDSDNDLNYINGVQTWEGSGVIRSETGTPALSVNGHVTFSAQVGPHEQNASPEMTVVIGICNSDGSTLQPIGDTWTISGITRVWFNEVKTTLTAYGLGPTDESWYFYIQVTNDGKWWVDEMQLEANVQTMPLPDNHPENFVRTSGSFVSNQSETSLMTQRKVCKSCAELILSKSERFGRTDESPIDEPVDTWAQEI